MKKKHLLLYLSLAICLLSINLISYSQSPYTLSPNWRFGTGAGLDFPSGNYPGSGGPSATTSSGTESVEASTSISDQTGALALYTNTMEVYNAMNTMVRDLRSSADNTCGGSATGGAVAIPDPASPTDTYYLFIANDITGGQCAGNGIHYYKFKKNGSGQAVYLSGPTLLAASAEVDESICAGNDGQGNYWIASHAQSTGSNAFKIWKVTPSGVAALADQMKGPNGAGDNRNAAIRISPCQNKIAWYSHGDLVVYEFDRETGILGNQLGAWNNGIQGIGLEFSPDANTLFTAGTGTIIEWYTIGGGSGSIAGSSSWSMQLGPDGKIYTSPGGNTLGIINDPNNPGTTTYSSISLGSGSTFRGFINMAWLSPVTAISSSINACDASFSFTFKNYFQADVPIDESSISWDFGDGNTSNSANPSHTYSSNGNYNVSVQFKDATCNQTFTATTQITISNCTTPPPPPGCTYTINASISSVSDITIDDSNPATVSFDGTSSTFDASGTEPYQYYWMNGSPDTTSAFSKNATSSLNFKYNGSGSYLSQGQYTIYLVIREGNCLDTANVTFNVTYIPNTPDCSYTINAIIEAEKEVMVDQHNPVTVSFSGIKSLFDPTGTEPYQYFWIINNADTLNAFSTGSSATLSFAYKGKGGLLPEGIYPIFLVIKEGKCLDTATVQLNVTHFFIPNLVTPNGDQINEKFEITNTSGRYDVEIYNRWGKKVYEEKGYTNGWDLSNESDGIYYYLVTDGESGKNYKGWVQIVR